MADDHIRVLLVEDDAADARLLHEMLKEFRGATFKFVHLTRLQDAEDRLRDGVEFDVFLLDLSLPDSSGFATFLRASVVAAHLPILVLSGFDDESVALQTVREGAQDYLVKGQTDGPLMGRAIRYAIERKRTEEQMKGALVEKEVLLKEIHHRVKNNLQVISSLLSLQSRNVEDPILLGLFKESRNRIMSMALVHEELYRTRDFAQVDLAGYIRNLVGNLLDSYRLEHTKVTPHLNLASVSIPIEKAIPCGLILNELVCNSLKHAFHPMREGQLWVALVGGDNGEVQLCVGDDGPGLPEGLDLTRSRTLGLELVDTLVRQIGGVLEYHAHPHSSFLVRFFPDADP